MQKADIMLLFGLGVFSSSIGALFIVVLNFRRHQHNRNLLTASAGHGRGSEDPSPCAFFREVHDTSDAA